MATMNHPVNLSASHIEQAKDIILQEGDFCKDVILEKVREYGLLSSKNTEIIFLNDPSRLGLSNNERKSKFSDNLFAKNITTAFYNSLKEGSYDDFLTNASFHYPYDEDYHNFLKDVFGSLEEIIFSSITQGPIIDRQYVQEIVESEIEITNVECISLIQYDLDQRRVEPDRITDHQSSGCYLLGCLGALVTAGVIIAGAYVAFNYFQSQLQNSDFDNDPSYRSQFLNSGSNHSDDLSFVVEKNESTKQDELYDFVVSVTSKKDDLYDYVVSDTSSNDDFDGANLEAKIDDERQVVRTPSQNKDYDTIVMQEGDCLWNIARDLGVKEPLISSFVKDLVNAQKSYMSGAEYKRFSKDIMSVDSQGQIQYVPDTIGGEGGIVGQKIVVPLGFKAIYGI